jgi:cytochrome c-type biogenesis protein CcmE
VLKNKKFLIGGIVILIALGSLAFMWFRDSATYYYTVTEVMSKGVTLQQKSIQIGGQVAPGSISRDDSTGIMTFRLVDRSDATRSIDVTYKGGVPSGFKEDTDAIVEGRLSSATTFAATQIIMKCPSKYIPDQ